MNEIFKQLIETSTLWLPALSWLLGQLSATQTGIKIEDKIKKRLKWIKDPEAEKAFQEAFNNGIRSYQQKEAGNEPAIALAKVLVHVANHDTSGLDRGAILEQIFTDRLDIDILSGVVSRHIFAIEGSLISKETVAKELRYLIGSYLKPAFRSQRYFAEVVGFADVIGLLKDIKEGINPPVNLNALQKGYYEKIAKKYEFLTMQGISPKVHNRTIGIKMKDVFISLEAKPVGSIEKNRSILTKSQRWSEFINEETHQGKISENIDENINNFIQDYLLHDEHVSHSKINAYSEIKKITRELINRNFASLFTVSKKWDLSLNWWGIFDFSLKDIVGNPQIVIQGHPGSGKSTIIKYISWAISTKNPEIIGENLLDLIPIPIRAIEFGENLEKGQITSLDEYILERDAIYTPLFKFAISAGKAFIFIDGLDEVGQPSLRSRVKERVDDFIADPAYSDNHIMITTRIVGYQPDGITGKFPHFELKELEEGQISKFVENWYKVIYEELPSSAGADNEKTQLLDAVLKNSSIHRMAQNPLLLTIIALIKWQGRALPEQRVLLYDAAAQTLIKSWPLTQRAVEFDELFVREWLAPVAEKIFSNPTSDLIDEYSLSEELVESMMTLKSLTKLEAKAQTRELLESISLHSGIILPRGVDDDGRNLFGFLHQTFAEYLTAYYYSGKWEDGKLDLAKYIYDPYWREVLLLMAGHLGIQRRAKAGQFIKAIIEFSPLPYDDVLCRNMLLAGRILGDSVPTPADVVEEVLNKLVDKWALSTYAQTKIDIENVFKLIKTTEYRPVLARIAISRGLEDGQVLSLASLIGPDLFVDRLSNIKLSANQKHKLKAEILIIELNDAASKKSLVEVLENTHDINSLSEICNSILKSKNLENSLVVIEKLALLFNNLEVSWFVSKTGLKDSYPLLERILESENIQLSLKAKWMLAIILTHSPKSEYYLSDCVSSDSSWYAFHAAKVLAEKKNSLGEDKMLSLMENSKDSSIQMQAALFLGRTKRKEVKTFFLSILDNSNDQSYRFEAARQLFENYDDLQGKSELQNFVREGSLSFALGADRSLRKASDFLVTDEYVNILFSNPDLLIQAEFAVSLALNDIKAGVDFFHNSLTVDDDRIFLSVSEKWFELYHKKKISLDEALPRIKSLLTSDDYRFQLRAAKLLSRLGQQEGLDKLEQLLNCFDVRIRLSTALYLNNTKKQETFEIFKRNMSKMLSDFEQYPLKDEAIIHSVADVAALFIRDNVTSTGELSLKINPEN